MEQLKSAPTADSTTNCKNSFLTSLVFPPILHFIVASCKTKHTKRMSSEVTGTFSIIYFVLLFFCEIDSNVHDNTQYFPQTTVSSTQPMAGTWFKVSFLHFCNCFIST